MGKKITINSIIRTYEQWFDFDINFKTKRINVKTLESTKDLYTILKEMIDKINNRGVSDGTIYALPIRYQGRSGGIVVLDGWTLVIGSITYQTNDCLIDDTTDLTFKKVTPINA